MSTNSTPKEIADAICANAKTGKWLSCTFSMETDDPARPQKVGVKAYGLWVQRIECAGMVDGIPAQRTQKALRAAVLDLLTRMESRE